MSAIKDMTQLGQRIAQSHGWAAAKAFKAYAMDAGDQAALSQGAVDLLKVFPREATSAAQMSAALAVSLERRMQAPIHVVAGSLLVEGVPVFAAGALDAGAFLAPMPDWRGHVWVMIGGYVVDSAIFRIAYSAQGPAALARHIDLVFGADKGLYVDPWKHTRQMGLRYEPSHVLSPEEVNHLMAQAFETIRQARNSSQLSPDDA